MLHSLELQNFRSYTELSISFSSSLVIISGPNAVGKTNLLESIFVLSTTKSFRSSDIDLLQYTKPFFRIEGIYDIDKVGLGFSTMSSKGLVKQKITHLNGKKQSLSSIIGINPVVLFEPNDLNLLAGPPGERRRYLDIVLSQTDSKYLKQLRSYRKILAQRNSLLLQSKRLGKSNISDHLFVYDVQLSEPSAYITRARQQFLEAISEDLIHNYIAIAQAGSKKQPILYFQPNLNLNADILAQYSQSHTADQGAAHTLTGPHRDNFIVQLNDGSQPITTSRGEARTLLLALKIAELSYVQTRSAKPPLLLLDDVFSELDENRQKHLLQVVQDNQTFITTTDKSYGRVANSQLIDLSGVSV